MVVNCGIGAKPKEVDAVGHHLQDRRERMSYMSELP
jgi:hypothetical protein